MAARFDLDVQPCGARAGTHRVGVDSGLLGFQPQTRFALPLRRNPDVPFQESRPVATGSRPGSRARSKATLVVAKLDRLAHNVAFLSALMEANVEFVACDNEHANRLTIHILAAVAEGRGPPDRRSNS